MTDLELAMRTYRINFGARKIGAIGCGERVTEERVAASDREAITALYDKWEHINTPLEIMPDGTRRRMSFD